VVKAKIRISINWIKKVEEAKRAAGMAMTDARLAMEKIDQALEKLEGLDELRPQVEEQLKKQSETLAALQKNIEQFAGDLKTIPRPAGAAQRRRQGIENTAE